MLITSRLQRKGFMDQLINLADLHQRMHAMWQPHSGQVPIGKAILYEGAKNVFVCAGRSFGKSRIASYLVARFALENGGSTNYVFLPFLNQGREIYWQSRLIFQAIPPEEIESTNSVEMRVILKNKSMIKICGADNVDSYRGVKCNPGSIVVMEELKDIKKEFMDAFMPNMSVNDPTLLMVGTPPMVENLFTEYMTIAQTSPRWRYFHAPTSANPYVSLEWLSDQKAMLERMKDMETYFREFEAKFVKGGKGAIFPQVYGMIHPEFEEPKDINKWHLVVSFDPASSSVFAASFALFNEYTKKVIIFDEIYQTEPTLMTAGKIYEQVEEIIKPWKKKVRGIRFIYDEAAAWFAGEVYDIPGSKWWMEKSRKHEIGVEGYIAITRTAFNAELITITKNCEKTIWEYQSYIKDEHGRIPKKNDHLINAISYKLQALGFSPDMEFEPKPEDPFVTKRALRIEDEMSSNNNLVDFDGTSYSNHSLEEI